MDVAESCVRCCKGSERSDSVPMYLAVLTMKARASPLANVCINSRPHETSGDESLRGADSRV